MSEGVFIEVDFFNRFKSRKLCSGDVFLSEQRNDERDIIAAFCDGLGSGQQASVAASLTATMALEYLRANIPVRRAAEMIMGALPLCPERHIPYSTFTMIDARADGTVRLIEYENPKALLLRDDAVVPIERTEFTLPRWDGRTLTYANFEMRLGDRLFFCSDGVTQAGLGSAKYPLGRGIENTGADLLTCLQLHPDYTAHELCKDAADRSTMLDGGLAGDDTTACMIQYRKPRILQILTGPPFAQEKDHAFAALATQPEVRTVISGGTTAALVARELGRSIDPHDISQSDATLPAASRMEGVDLVTEGSITLSRTVQLLQGDEGPRNTARNAAGALCSLLLHSDFIRIAVGTAVNPAHQDPNMPVELDIRRNIIRQLAKVLEEKFLKRVEITYY